MVEMRWLQTSFFAAVLLGGLSGAGCDANSTAEKVESEPVSPGTTPGAATARSVVRTARVQADGESKSTVVEHSPNAPPWIAGYNAEGQRMRARVQGAVFAERGSVLDREKLADSQLRKGPPLGYEYEPEYLAEWMGSFEALEVLTPPGPVELEIEKVMPDSSSAEFITESSKQLGVDFGVTFAMPVGEMSDEATYRRYNDDSSGAGDDPEFSGGGTEEAWWTVEGDFPGRHARITVRHSTVRLVDESVQTTRKLDFDGLGDADVRPRAVIDLEGDGTEGVLFSVIGFETCSYRWLHFTQEGQPEVDSFSCP